ncbi:hypothetical protein L9F63_028230, partial [Diploptera punctata]
EPPEACRGSLYPTGLQSLCHVHSWTIIYHPAPRNNKRSIGDLKPANIGWKSWSACCACS